MRNKIINQDIVVYFMVVFVLLFMVIGYASKEEVKLDETLMNVFDEKSILIDTDYPYEIIKMDDGIILSIEIDEDQPFTSVKINNTSEYMFTYIGNKSIYDNDYYPSITGIIPGDYLLPNEERRIYIKNIDRKALGNILIDLEFHYNALSVDKPYIMTNITNPVIPLLNNRGIIEIDIMNQYDSSIELEFYFNDDDLGLTLVDNKLFLNREERRNIALEIKANNTLSEVSTTLYAKVLSDTKVDDVYMIENIIFKMDA